MCILPCRVKTGQSQGKKLQAVGKEEVGGKIKEKEYKTSDCGNFLFDETTGIRPKT